MGRLQDVERHYKPSEVQQLSPLTRAIARSVLTGLTTDEIATRYGLTPTRIVQIIHSPIVKQEIARIEDRLETQLIDKELVGLQNRASEVIAQELFSEMPSKRRTESAFKLLDRTGYHPKNESSITGDQTINFISLAPLPGENPEEALARIDQLKKEIEIVTLPSQEDQLDLLQEMD